MRYLPELLAVALIACAHSTPPTETAYPKAYAGPPSDPLESALALAHRAVAHAREQKDFIQLACLRARESKLESLRAERATLAPPEVDARARQLQSEMERCVGGR